MFCIAYGSFPLLLTWLGFRLSQHFDCEVSSITFDCASVPWLGAAITNMVFLHWFAIFTVPLALLNIVIIVFSLIARR